MFIKGAGDKAFLVEKYLNQLNGVEELPKTYPKDEVFATNVTKTRAFIKIQDGCNRFCTYCIIPYLRGRSRSRDIDEIIKEASTLTDINEVVLTGVDLSDYHTPTGTLVDLIKKFADLPMRKRFGSLEVHVVTKELLQAMQQSNFCPHFHLSLQSGSDDVLKKMNRHYTTSEFFDAVQLIRSVFPNAGITTDVIVGFPTESDQNFLESCEFVKKVGFDDIHVFPFSARKGTIASKMPPVDNATLNLRADKMNEIKHQLKQASLERQIGTIQEVLTEESKGDYVVGYTQNYTKVYLPKKETTKNKILKIFVEKRFEDGVLGSII